ncbi:hypothetical protein CBR_g11186 [Chara braunii]|uniref:Uncharacterized protein n=1 Tax=Chara braunii TaxID=69332 RepID=A0A388KQD9_CHABU|nr:hypothetical protein CBR_g11186 [Chara braunii]|eukprot:GBG72256.1 hypothetical protein CBR_g11186 [Chara braunii]
MAVPGAQEEDDDDERGGRSKSKKKAMAVSSSQAAAEALHLLGAMKQLLPLMSAKAIARASHRMANLCSLQQPMLTRLVANAIKSLSDEVAGKTSLSDDVAGKGKSEVVPDVLAETVVNILELEEEGRIGRKRDPDVIMTILEMVKSTFLDLHDRDRAVCSKKLPQVFNLLAGNLASEQEEVVFGTADCLKLLIVCCIDDEMINEGQMQVGLVAERRKGGLTPIERLSVMVEGLLGYQYASAWETTLVVVSTFLEKLAIGTAVAAMGPEQFLKILPLEMDNQDLSHSRAWLLPIMKQHVVGARLQFFAEYFLPLSAKLRERARTCAAEGRPVAAKNSEACIVQIWAILPALCNYPSDTARSFRLLAKAIGDALLKEPELRGSICSSLQILINQNKKARGDPGLNNEEDAEEEKVSDADGKPLTAAEERARALHTPEVVSANLAAIGAFARNFLPLLFNVFISLEPEKRAFLQQTIDAFASVADPATIKSFFMSVMEKLVEALKEAASAKTAADGDAAMQVDGESNKAEIATTRRCTFMELAVSLVQGLDDESLHVLYRTARVGIQDSDFSVQKKSYKLLAKMYELKGAFMASLTQDMLEALLASLGVCHSTARRGRLICVQHVVINLIKRKDPQASDALATLISEVILATKENNAKTRITAFDIILNIGKSTEEVGGPDQGGGNLQRFFTMVVGGLAGTTTRMVSCSVMALARLLYEFSTRLSHTVPQLLPTVLLLLRSKSREIVKAVLGFVKVVVMRLPGTELEPHLGTMIEGLTVWSDDTKNHFKAKVRLIFEMLLKRCGYDAIAAVMPEEHMKLLTNIRKSRDRAERHRKEGRSVAGDGAQSMKSRATTAR